MDNRYNLYNLQALFGKYLAAGNKKLTAKNYLSDLRHFLGWLSLKIDTDKNPVDLVQEIDSALILDYKQYLLDSAIPLRTINRRLSSLRKFFSFCISQNWISANPAKEVQNAKNQKPQIEMNLLDANGKNAEEVDETVPKAQIAIDSDQSSFFSKYLSYVVPFVLMLIMVFGFYNNFFKKTKTPFAAVTELKRAGRLLSFQGRLTDSLGNPITTATNVQFRLYNAQSAGTALYTSGVCKTIPDQDGIFNTLLGKDCGSEIGSSLFTENTNVYLGVTVGSDSEMTPRQQIANVGYSITSEFLQGLPPGTDKSNIPYIDKTGTLLITAASPYLKSSSGSFTIQGQALTLNTPSGSGGSITINPDTGGNTLVAAGNLGVGSADPKAKLSVGDNKFQVNSSGNLVKVNSVAYSWPSSQGSSNTALTNDGSGNLSWSSLTSAGGWTDDGSLVRLNTSTDNITIGSATNLAKLGVDGDTDEIQFLVQGHSTQTSNLIVFENSDGTDQFVVTNSGNVTSTGDLAVNGGDLTSSGTTFNLINATATTLNIGGAATTLEIGATTGTTSINNSLTIDGATTLGDASGDTVTSNAASWTFANDTNVTLTGGVNGLSFDTSTLSIDATNDRVGVGTTAPDDSLHIAGGQLRIDNNTDTTNKGCFRYNGTLNEIQYSNDCSTFQGFSAAAAGGWTDSGTVVNLTTSTDDVAIGTGTSLGKLTVDGDTDEIQLIVQGNSTQTSNLVVFENSAGTDQFVVTNVGNVTATGDLTVTGNDITFGNGESISNATDGTILINPTTFTLSGTTTLTASSLTTLTTATTLSLGSTTTLNCPDCADFDDLEDTLDLDAALTLNQGTNTWTQNFTGTTTDGLTYNANSLTSGSAAIVTSSATGFTDTDGLVNISLTGSNAANTGTVFKVSSTGALSAASAAIITNLGTGTTFRVNDETGDSDATPFIIDNAGNVGIGDPSPISLLTVGSGDLFQVNSSGNLVKLNNVTYSWPSSQGAASTSLINDGSGNLTWSASGASSGGGWTDDGTTVRLTTVTDNVGIGTASPSNKLHLVGTQRIETSSAGDGLLFYSGATQIGQATQQTALDAATTILRIEGASGRPLALGSSGTTLELQGVFQNTNNSTTAYRFNNAAGAAVFDIDTTNARAGIGTTGPDRKLDVLDASNPQLRLTQADGTVYGEFQVDSSGNLTVTTTGSTVTFSGDTVSASDFSCSSCLDFAEFEDTLDLDAALTLNQGTNTWSQSYTGTTSTGLSYTANSLTTGSALNITTASSPTGASSTSNGVMLNLTQSAATNATTYTGLNLKFTNNPTVAGNTENAFQIQNQATTNITDNAVAALLLLDNADTSTSGSTVVTDALRIINSGDISGGITNAINIDDTDITNDIVLQNDEVISNDTDGTISLNPTILLLSGTTTITASSLTTLTTAATLDLSGDLEVSGNDIKDSSSTIRLSLGSTNVITGNLSTTGDIAVNGGDITTTSSTFNIASDGTGATTLNLGFNSTTGLNIGPTGASGTIAFSGGSADTGCTLNGTNGNLTCSGDITGSSTGTQGYWTRSGTTLSPSTAGDNISISATTDITTGTNEDLTLLANGSGSIVLNDTTDLNNNLIVNIGASGTDFTTGGGLTLAEALVVNDDASFVLDAGEKVLVNAATTDSTGTAGALDVDLDTTSSQAGIDIDAETITDAAVDTVSGLKITATQTSTDDDVLYGIQVANLAGTADAGNEYAIYQAGTAWDFGLFIEDAAHFNTTVNIVSTLDARGDISDSTGNLTLNDAVDISGALTANSTAIFNGLTTFNTDVDFTFAGTENIALTSSPTTDAGVTTDTLQLTLTTPAHTAGTNVHNAIDLDTTIGNATAGTNTVNVVNIGAITGDAQVTLNGINIGALTGTAATEYAINVGAGWDSVLRVGGTEVINGSGQVVAGTITGTLFTLDGDDADTEAIVQGNTLLVAGGTNGIDTDVSATDTVTLNLDTTEIGTTTFGSGSGFTWTFDAGATDPTLAFASAQITAGATTVVLAGTTTLTASSLTSMTTGTLTLDVGTTLTLGTDDDLSTTGDVTITGTGTENLEVSSSPAADSAGTNNATLITLSTPVDTTGTNTHQGLFIDPTIGNATGGTNTVNLIATDAVAGDAQVSLNGINIGALTGTTAEEHAIVVGAGWDSTFRVGSTTVINGSGQVVAGQITGTLFTLDGDDADTEAIVQGNTLLVAGGTNGIDTDVSATDTVTLNLDTTEIGTTTFNAGATDPTWTFNTSGATDPTLAFANSSLTISSAATIATDQITLNLFNTTATTVNFAGDSTALTIGATTGTATIRNATTVITGILDVNGGDGSDFAGNVTFNDDVILTLAGAEGLAVSYASAPTEDLVTISNSGQASATDGVDGLQLTFGTSNASGNTVDITPSFAGGATDTLTYNVIDIDAFSPTNAAGTDIVRGLNIGNLTDPGTTITSTAVSIGTGWDTGIVLNSGIVTSSTTITLDSSGTVQLGTDDDFLPQLGAGDADIGATGTRWDNVFAVAGNFSGTVAVNDLSCADCLDFAEFEDTLDLDAATDINLGANLLSIDLDSTGDFQVRDGTTAFATFTDDSSIVFAATSQSVASAAGAEFTTFTVTPPTITLTGTTQVTAQMDSILLNRPTIAGDTATVTVDDAATLTIAGAPSESTNVSLTDAYALKINSASTTSTNSYALYLDAQTGASNNYAAVFASGNVGIGDVTPSSLLEVGNGTDSLQVSSVGDLTFVDADGTASITGPAGGAFNITAANSQALALATTTAGDITLTPAGAGDVVIDTDSNTQVTLNGGGDGVDSLVLTDGDILISDGDLDLSGGDFNVVLDVADTVNLTGTQPAAVGTTPGTAASDLIGISAATGGNTTIATTGTGGIGQGLSWTFGTGGTAASANTASTGGAGGAYSITSGTGGAAAATGTNVGGAGGVLILVGGTGGAASGGTSNTGGVGGAISITAGAAGSGGDVNGGTLTLNSGAVTGTGTSTLNIGTSNATTFNLGTASSISTLNFGETGSGTLSLVIAGGSGDTGCTIDGSNGNLTCSGTITTTNTSGTVGFWTRSNTNATLTPTTDGDDIVLDAADYIGLSSSTARYIFNSGEIDIQNANLDFNDNLAINIGAAGTDFTTGGGLTLAELLTVNDDVDLVFAAGENLDINASTAANTTTVGVIDLNVASITANNVGLNVDYTMNDGVTAADDLFAAKINLTQNDVDGDFFGLVITNQATSAVVGADDVECLVCLDNAENTAGVVTDAIRISSSGVAAGITNDIKLQNSETISNSTDGTITIGTTTLTLSGTTTLTASSLATFTTAASLSMGSTTTLTLGASPTIAASSGDITIGTNDVKFSATGGSSGDPDVDVDGFLNVDGAALFSSDVDFGLAGGENVVLTNSSASADQLALTVTVADTQTADAAQITITDNTVTSGVARGLVIETGDGSATLDSALAINHTDTTQAMTAGIEITGAASTTITTAIDLDDTEIGTGISLGANDIIGTSAAITFSEFSVSSTTGSVTINDTGDAGALTVEGTNLDINDLTFTGAGTVTVGAGAALTITANAASTWGTSVGDLTLDTGDEVILADTDTIIIGGHAGNVAYNVIANAGEAPEDTTNINADNDLYIGDSLEIDGTLIVGSILNCPDCIDADDLADTIDIDAASETGIAFEANTDTTQTIFTISGTGLTNGTALSISAGAANLIAGGELVDLVMGAATAGNGMNITTTGAYTGTGLLTLTANSITSGKGLSIDSSSTAFTGILANISLTGNNAANTGTLLKLTNDGSLNTGSAFIIDTEQTLASQNLIRILSDALVNDTAVFSVNANGATTIGAAAGNDKVRASLTSYGDTIAKGKIDIESIANITDIFVYDTSKDPDGGRWINDERAKASSWYNETIDATGAACVIDTNDRCGTRDFPEKAIIIATTTKLYIFDAQDNTLWMDFRKGATTTEQMIGPTTNSTGSSIYALNGKVYYGNSGSVGGFYILDFKRDRGFRYNATDDYYSDKNVANRNSTVTWTTGPSSPIVDTIVNDVHVQIVGGQTLIVVATDTGSSVIKYDANQVFSYSDVTGDDVNSVWINRNGDLYALNETQQQLERWNLVITDTASELNGTPDKTWDETTTPALFPTAQTIANAPGALYITERITPSDNLNVIYVGHAGGLSVINTQEGVNGSVKYYKNSYITEEMVGDIRNMMPFAGTGTLSGDTTLGADDTDSSVKQNAWTTKSTPTRTGAIRGNGIDFDGTDDYVCTGTTGTCADDADLDPAGTKLSIGGWFKRDSNTADTDTIIAKWGDDTGTDKSFRIMIDSADTITFSTRTSAVVSSSSTQTYTDTTNWHFVVGIYDGGTQKLYVDGIQVDSDTQTGNLTNSGVAGTVAADLSGAANAAANFLDGDIDETFITAETLSAGQIKRIYEVGKKALEQHTASRITGVTGADTYQRLMGNASAGTSTTNRVFAVATDDLNQFIYAGLNDATTNTGGVTVLGADSDSAVDLYDATANTGKDDDVSAQFAGSDVVAIGVSGAPVHAYNSGTTSGNNNAVIAIAGTNDTATSSWMESSDLGLYSTLARLTDANFMKLGNNIRTNNSGLSFYANNYFNDQEPSNAGTLDLGGQLYSLNRKTGDNLFKVQGMLDQTYNYFFTDFFGDMSSITSNTVNGWEGLSFLESAGTGTCTWNTADNAESINGTLSSSANSGLVSTETCHTHETDNDNFQSTSNPVLETSIKLNETSSHNVWIGFFNSTPTLETDAIFFESTAGGNWQVITESADSKTTTDTGVAPSTTSYQTLRIEASSSLVKFYINGVLKANHTTNIPTAKYGISFTNEKDNVSGNKIIYLDYIKIWQDPPAPGSGQESLPQSEAQQQYDPVSGADLAERYPVYQRNFGFGELVSIDPERKGYVKQTSKAYDSTMLGITSQTPGQVLGQNTNETIEVALQGRVPIKIASTSAAINAGDFITSSNEPGKGMKATRKGYSIGKALEDWDPQNGKNLVLVFIDRGFYFPEFNLTSISDFIITTDEQNPTGEYVYNPDKFKLKNSLTEEIVEDVAVYSEALIGNLKAGFIQTQKLIADVGQFNNLTANHLTINNKLVSPVIETKDLVATGEAKIAQVETSNIKPEEGKDLVIDLSHSERSEESSDSASLDSSSLTQNDSKGQLSKLIIKGFEGKTVATIDASGAAYFAHSVTTDEVKANKLTAEEIDSRTTRELREKLSELSNGQTTSNLTAQQFSNSLNDVQKLIAEIKNQPLSDPEYYQKSEAINTKLETNSNLNITGNTLTLTGTANVMDMNVTNSLIAGNVLVRENSVISLASELNISALSQVNFFGGNLTIASNGDLTTKGKITAKEIVAEKAELDSLTLNSLAIKNKYLEATQSGAIIASADNLVKNGLASPAIETKTESAGIGILPANSSEIIIYNEKITDESLVYLTSTSPSPNGQLSVIEKVSCQQFDNLTVQQSSCTPYFKVSIGHPSHPDISFNWLLIN